MKKVVVILISTIFLMSSMATMIAAVDAPTSIYVTKAPEAKKIVLNFENMFADKVKCTFLGQGGGVIFTDVIYTSDKVSKKYDLSKLPVGIYTVEVNDLMKVEKLTLSVTNNSVEFVDNASEVIYKPTVWLNEDKKVDFNLLALGNEAKVIISNDQGQLYSHNFKGQTSISKRFDVSKFAGQDIIVSVYHQGEIFTYNLSL